MDINKGKASTNELETKVKTLEDTVKELQYKLAETEAGLEEKEKCVSRLQDDLETLVSDISKVDSSDVQKIASPLEVMKAINKQALAIKSHLKSIDLYKKQIAVLSSKLEDAKKEKTYDEKTIKILIEDVEKGCKDKSLFELKKIVDSLRQEIEQLKASTAKKLDYKQKIIDRIKKEKSRKGKKSDSNEEVLAVYTHDEPNGDTELLDELDRTQREVVAIKKELHRVVHERQYRTDMLETQIEVISGQLRKQRKDNVILKDELKVEEKIKSELKERLSEAEKANVNQVKLQGTTDARNAELAKELHSIKEEQDATSKIKDALQQNLNAKMTINKELELIIEGLRDENRQLGLDNVEMNKREVKYRKELEDLKECMNRMEKDLDNRVLKVTNLKLTENEASLEGKVMKVGQVFIKTRKALRHYVKVCRSLRAEKTSRKNQIESLGNIQKEFGAQIEHSSANDGIETLLPMEADKILLLSSEETNVEKAVSSKTEGGTCMMGGLESMSEDIQKRKGADENNICGYLTASQELDDKAKYLGTGNEHLRNQINRLHKENAELMKKCEEKESTLTNEDRLSRHIKITGDKDITGHWGAVTEQQGCEIRYLPDEGQQLLVQISDANSKRIEPLAGDDINDTSMYSQENRVVCNKTWLDGLRNKVVHVEKENVSMTQALEEKKLVIREQETCLDELRVDNEKLRKRCEQFQMKISCTDHACQDSISESKRAGGELPATNDSFSFAMKDIRDFATQPATSELQLEKENNWLREELDCLRVKIQTMNNSKDLAGKEIVESYEKKLNDAKEKIKELLEKGEGDERKIRGLEDRVDYLRTEDHDLVARMSHKEINDYTCSKNREGIADTSQGDCSSLQDKVHDFNKEPQEISLNATVEKYVDMNDDSSCFEVKKDKTVHRSEYEKCQDWLLMSRIRHLMDENKKLRSQLMSTKSSHSINTAGAMGYVSNLPVLVKELRTENASLKEQVILSQTSVTGLEDHVRSLKQILAERKQEIQRLETLICSQKRGDEEGMKNCNDSRSNFEVTSDCCFIILREKKKLQRELLEFKKNIQVNSPADYEELCVRLLKWVEQLEKMTTSFENVEVLYDSLFEEFFSRNCNNTKSDKNVEENFKKIKDCLSQLCEEHEEKVETRNGKQFGRRRVRKVNPEEAKESLQVDSQFYGVKGNTNALAESAKNQKREMFEVQKQTENLHSAGSKLRTGFGSKDEKSVRGNLSDGSNDNTSTRREGNIVEEQEKDRAPRKMNTDLNDRQFRCRSSEDKVVEQHNVVLSLQNQLRDISRRNLDLELSLNELRSAHDSSSDSSAHVESYPCTGSKGLGDGAGHDIMDGMDSRLARIDGYLSATKDTLDKIYKAKKIYENHKELFYQ